MTVSGRQQRGDTIAVIVSYLTFIGLGLAFGLLGLAWPSMRAEFGLEIDAVGVLLLLQTLGYIGASFFTSRLTATWGTARVFLMGTGLMAVGLAGYFFAPTWSLVILFGLAIGIGGGTMDAGLNNYVAAYYGPRQMNWLHASFGIGLTLGPILMTSLIERELSWRWGYGAGAVLMLALALVVLQTRRLWRDVIPETETREPRRQVSLTETLRLPTLWLSGALFFVYAGMEIGAGQWAYTLFTEGRGIAPETAGWWVTVYGASFTVGRVFFGFVSARFDTLFLLRLCMLGTIAGAALWWLNFTDLVGFLGLALLGFAQAPLFPLFTLRTADRVGASHAPNAIGIQVSAAGVGVAVLPGLAGVLAKHLGMSVLAPLFLVLAVLVLVLHEVTLLGPKRARLAPEPGAD